MKSSLDHLDEDAKADLRGHRRHHLDRRRLPGRRPATARRPRGTARPRASSRSPARGSPGSTTTTPRSPESFTADGWLRTGDVAVVDPTGYIRLVDRTKDVVKSGGEWISSVELENEIMGHPGGGRGGRDRHPAREVGRAAAGLRGGEAGGGADPRGGARPTSTAGWPSGGCPTTSCSSTRCPRPRSASSRRRTCARSSRTTNCPTSDA